MSSQFVRRWAGVLGEVRGEHQVVGRIIRDAGRAQVVFAAYPTKQWLSFEVRLNDNHPSSVCSFKEFKDHARSKAAVLVSCVLPMQDDILEVPL